MNNYAILFYPQKDRAVYRLRMRISWKCQVWNANVGFELDSEKFDRNTMRCKRNSYHGKNMISASTINSRIQHWEDIAHDIMQKHESITKDELAQEFMKAVNPEKFVEPTKTVKQRTFIGDFDEFVSQQGDECGWSDATYKKMVTIRAHLIAWKEGEENLTYDLFDEKGMIELMNYFIAQRKKNGTITRYIKTVKWFLRWAKAHDLCDAKLALEYRPHLKDVKKRVIYLTWSELMAVYNCTFNENETRLAHARDKFCFSCFTGLRYSDVVSLNKTDVSEDAIYITTQKTHDLLRIELNKYSKAILERYMDSDGPAVFPKVSTQKTNDYIKEIGKKCKLDSVISETYYVGGKRLEEKHRKWELLTTHCGRRTFICNALMLGIPADVVMKWTGHSDYKAMRPYIDIADDAKKLAMALFDEKK